MYKYFPHTPEDIAAMLKATGHVDIDDLFDDIPRDVRFKGEYKVPSAASELEVTQYLSTLAKLNQELIIFRGAGATGPVRGARFDMLSHSARCRRPVRHGHRHVRRGDVAVPDSREHRHGLRPYAHHGHSSAVHELRLVVHGGEFLHARHDRVGVDAQLRA